MDTMDWTLVWSISGERQIVIASVLSALSSMICHVIARVLSGASRRTIKTRWTNQTRSVDRVHEPTHKTLNSSDHTPVGDSTPPRSLSEPAAAVCLHLNILFVRFSGSSVRSASEVKRLGPILITVKLPTLCIGSFNPTHDHTHDINEDLPTHP